MQQALDYLYAALPSHVHAEVRHLLLQHGTPFGPGVPPAGLPEPVPKSCYFNAFRIAEAEPQRFVYFEGVGVSWQFDGNEATEASLIGGATPHAWCVDRSGAVVDTTWHQVSSIDPGAYLGIELPLHEVRPFAKVGSRGTFEGMAYDLSGLRDRLGWSL